MKISCIKQQIPVFFLCIALFLFPSIIRETIISSPLMIINYIGLIAICYMYSVAKNNDYTIYVKSDFHNIMFCNNLLIVMLFISFAILTYNRKDYATCALYVVTLLIPVLIINCDWKNGRSFEKCVAVWVKALEICCYIIFLCGVIDKFTGNKISIALASIYNVASLFNLANAGRLVSYMGHSLLSCEIFIIYYVTQYLFNLKIRKKKEKILSIFISLVGVAFAGSKGGILILLTIILIYHANLKSIKIIPVVIIGVLILYKIGVFDVLIKRIITGILSGDLTTNRNTSLMRLLANGRISFKWFAGKNIDYGWEMTAALEYPILRWAYQFGIVVAAILSIIVFIIPIIKILIIRVDKEFFWGCIAIMSFVNTYNGLAVQRDHMLIYCTEIFFIVNMARFSKGFVEK